MFEPYFVVSLKRPFTLQVLEFEPSYFHHYILLAKAQKVRIHILFNVKCFK